MKTKTVSDQKDWACPNLARFKGVKSAPYYFFRYRKTNYQKIWCKKEVPDKVCSKLSSNLLSGIYIVCIVRANQNTGGALLAFLMRTAMYKKSRVSSAISVCDN